MILPGHENRYVKMVGMHLIFGIHLEGPFGKAVQRFFSCGTNKQIYLRVKPYRYKIPQIRDPTVFYVDRISERMRI